MLAEALNMILRSFRQNEFYTDPRFHASIAWALLEGPLSGSKSISESHQTAQKVTMSSISQSRLHVPLMINGSDSVLHPASCSFSIREPVSDSPTTPTNSLKKVLAIPHFPETLI